MIAIESDCRQQYIPDQFCSGAAVCFVEQD